MSAAPHPATGTEPLPRARRRRPLRTSLLLVAVVLALLLVFLITSVALQRTESGRFIVAEPVETVRLDLTVGRVELIAGEGDTVEVAYTRRYTWRAPQLDRSARDGVLILGGGCGGVWYGVVCSIDYRVTLPADTEIVGSTSAGDIVLDGLSGPVDVATSAGDVDALAPGGPLRLRSSAGDVTVTDATSSRIEARTSAGDVDITAREAPTTIVAETSAGDVDILVPDEAYDVTAETTAGDVTVDVVDDPGAERTITVRTSAGDVSVLAR
ncbi:MAG TPA: DUF4097 family beta strand repeat-containing protein [Egibacteraceae bacterium]